jgi:putative N-acetylmannosamine-6-phosphate epimerase
MIRLIAFAFALALAASAQAMPFTPLHQPDGMITQVREACGAGRVRINGVCVARTTKRHVRREVRRCARWHGGTCVHYY